MGAGLKSTTTGVHVTLDLVLNACGFKIHILTGVIRTSPMHHRIVEQAKRSIIAPNCGWPKFLRRLF